MSLKNNISKFHNFRNVYFFAKVRILKVQSTTMSTTTKSTIFGSINWSTWPWLSGIVLSRAILTMVDTFVSSLKDKYSNIINPSLHVIRPRCVSCFNIIKLLTLLCSIIINDVTMQSWSFDETINVAKLERANSKVHRLFIISNNRCLHLNSNIIYVPRAIINIHRSTNKILYTCGL